MSGLALVDELLQDFEASGSEAGDDEHEDGFFGEAGLSAGPRGEDAPMEDTRDENEDPDDDEDMMDGLNGSAPSLGADDDDAKAKIEKMQLGGVRDVRSVAGLMKTLTPVLEVSNHSPAQVWPDDTCQPWKKRLHLYFLSTSPDSFASIAAENRTLPVATHRLDNRQHWQRGGSPRVPPPDPVEQPVHPD
jgi:hypothetical protein